jgi:hypothetical protein
VDFQRVIDWWKSNTDPAARFNPPKRLWNRLTPTTAGLIVGLLITVIICVVVLVAARP